MAILILMAISLMGVGKPVLVSDGKVHIHTHNACTSWRVPLLCVHNIPEPFCQVRGGPPGYLSSCKSRLKMIAAALETYATDHAGRFPEALTELTPAYLKSIPGCHECRDLVVPDTYSAGYAHATNTDAYTLVCTGTRHRSWNQGANYPQYTSTQGLITQ